MQPRKYLTNFLFIGTLNSLKFELDLFNLKENQSPRGRENIVKLLQDFVAKYCKMWKI